jgi:hypothetical protein
MILLKTPLFVLVETLAYPPVEAVEPTDNTVKLSFLEQLFKTKRI